MEGKGEEETGVKEEKGFVKGREGGGGMGWSTGWRMGRLMCGWSCAGVKVKVGNSLSLFFSHGPFFFLIFLIFEMGRRLCT